MIDRLFLYKILYALVAKDGREEALFGNCSPLAEEAFSRSLVSGAFPELWFELPLAGQPWFDLHALVSHTDVEGLSADDLAASYVGLGDVYADGLSWFANQPYGVRQLALSYDVSRGDIDNPAIQLLVSNRNLAVSTGFLNAIGRGDAASAYRSFIERIPEEWFACYSGSFPGRTSDSLSSGVRVECIVGSEVQPLYASDPSLLVAHFEQVGLPCISDMLIECCHALADTPFELEFQFDVTPDGFAGDTVGASLRFACPPGTESHKPFDVDGPAGDLMRQVEEWDLADGRWRELEHVKFAKKAEWEGRAETLFCHPAFLKLRWRNGEPVDAKTYLMAGINSE